MYYFSPVFQYLKLEIVCCLSISRSRPYLLFSNVFKLKNKTKNPPKAELVFALTTISRGLIPNMNLYWEPHCWCHCDILLRSIELVNWKASGSAEHHHRNWGEQKSSVRERKKNVGSPGGKKVGEWERERWRENMNKWKIMSSLMWAPLERPSNLQKICRLHECLMQGIWLWKPGEWNWGFQFRWGRAGT